MKSYVFLFWPYKASPGFASVMDVIPYAFHVIDFASRLPFSLGKVCLWEKEIVSVRTYSTSY